MLTCRRLLIAGNSSHFTTPTFTFVVQGRMFYVSTGLIASLSSPLNCLITLNMKEKGQGYATLEGVTPATFDRFLEWATKGYYTPPLPTVESQTEDEGISGEPPEEDENAAAAPIQASVEGEDTPEGSGDSGDDDENDEDYDGYEEHETASMLRRNVREAFYSREPSVRRVAIYTSPPRRNLNAWEKYTNIFLCHAQLYVFADAQDIQELKTLALEELHAVLAVFELHLERTIDVLDLLHYVYDNTVSPLHGEEPLRRLMSDYVSFEMDTLMLDGRFCDLILVDGGDMLADFMSSVAARIRP